jgi:hypothetical protein
MSSFRVVVPTRDSAKWVGVFLNAYRALGVEPLYIVDTRSADGTLELLSGMRADLISFTPSGDFVEAGMIEFGSKHCGARWVLRFDDDEFPSRALLKWVATKGIKSLNQGVFLSRRELFLSKGDIFYSRSDGRYNVPVKHDYLSPQLRFHNVDRVRYLAEVHTPGFEELSYFSFAPMEAPFVHCNCLLRTPMERLEKIRRYEAIEVGSCWRIADEYLPALFDFERHHRASNDGLAEFAPLFAALPIIDADAIPILTEEETVSAREEVARLARMMFCSAEEMPRYQDADHFFWVRRIPKVYRHRLAELLCTLGMETLGRHVFDYSDYSQRFDFDAERKNEGPSIV